MDWGDPGFVMAIIAISTAGWLINNWIRARHGYALEDEWGGKTSKAQSGETQKLLAENAELKVEVLEGIQPATSTPGVQPPSSTSPGAPGGARSPGPVHVGDDPRPGDGRLGAGHRSALPATSATARWRPPAWSPRSSLPEPGARPRARRRSAAKCR